MGGPTSNIRGLCKGDGTLGIGEVEWAVVTTGGFRTTAEGHVKIDFGSSVGEEATGAGMVGAREERMSRSLVVTGEGK